MILIWDIKKKTNKTYEYKFPQIFNFIKLSRNYGYGLDSYRMILGLRRTKEDLQQGTIEKYWNVNYEGNALGTNYPIFSEDVTGFIILDYFNHNENSFMKIDNLQATIIDEFGDEDDIFDDRESLSEKYDQYKPWKYADRLFLLVACANYIAKKLDVKEINIRKEDDADYGIYKRAYEFLNRDIKTEIQTKLR